MDNLIILSSSFENEGSIPGRYTCEGEDISPEIRWQDIPGGVKSLALICDDPDAPGGDFVHWVVFNIPPESNGLPEAVTVSDIQNIGAISGVTHYGRSGYGGPCPPRGSTHHYHFKLYGLDIILEEEENMTKYNLLKKMEGHIIAKGEIVGLFER